MSNTQIIIGTSIIIGSLMLITMYRTNAKYSRLIKLNKEELEDKKPKDQYAGPSQPNARN